VTDPAAVENTETFRAAIAPQVSAMIKATVGSANISNADREFAEKAAAGSITLDEASIKRMITVMDKMGREAVALHNSKVDQVYPEGQGFDRERALFLVPEPAPVAGAADKPDAGATDGLTDDDLKYLGLD
jgi:Rieske Fe-S protein